MIYIIEETEDFTKCTFGNAQIVLSDLIREDILPGCCPTCCSPHFVYLFDNYHPSYPSHIISAICSRCIQIIWRSE